MRHPLTSLVFAIVLLSSLPSAQTGPGPLTLLTAQGRRPFPTTILNAREMVAADDLVSLLQVAVRDDTTAGGLTISYKGRSVVVSQDQAVASVNGRLISLPSPAVRNGRRWFVPIDFLPRALSQIYDGRIELRQISRLLIVGNLRVPRVTVRLDTAGPPTRMSIEASPPTLISPSVESGRLNLRLDADAIDVGPLPAAGGLLEQARTEGNTVVLVLSPRAGLPRASQAVGDNASRMNVEVPVAGQATATAPAPSAQAAVPTPAQAPAATPESTTSADVPVPAPVTGGVRVLVIDPGHGGADAGVTGPSGVQEKTLTLDIARRIKTLVETRIAMRVLLTREDDRDMTLDARAALANNARADLFISLHLNASLSPMASGAEVYQFASDQDGANRPGASQALTLPTAAGGSRTVTLVPWNLAQLRHHDASTLLSNLLESSLRAHVPMSIRPTQEARLRLLAGLDMAAASIELAYLTNPAQDMAAQGEDFQNQAAQAIVEAVMAYRAAWRGDR